MNQPIVASLRTRVEASYMPSHHWFSMLDRLQQCYNSRWKRLGCVLFCPNRYYATYTNFAVVLLSVNNLFSFITFSSTPQGLSFCTNLKWLSHHTFYRLIWAFVDTFLWWISSRNLIFGFDSLSSMHFTSGGVFANTYSPTGASKMRCLSDSPDITYFYLAWLAASPIFENWRWADFRFPHLHETIFFRFTPSISVLCLTLIIFPFLSSLNVQVSEAYFKPERTVVLKR